MALLDLNLEPRDISGSNLVDLDLNKKTEPRSLWKEIPVETYAGATIDLPKQVGQALQWMSEPGEYWHGKGKEIQDWADEREKSNPDLAPQNEGRGILGQALSTGARALAPSLATMLPAGAGGVVGPAVGLTRMAGAGIGAATGAFGLFGAAQAQETYDKLIKSGVPEPEAKEAGWINLMIEGGGETIGDIAGLKLFGMLGKTALKGVSPVAGAIADATDTAIVKPFLKQLPKTAATEISTEFGQNYGEAWIERKYGATNAEDPLHAGIQGAESALGMTLLLAPFGLAGFAVRAKQNQRLAEALTDPDSPKPNRIAASKILYDEINAVNPDAARAWSENSAFAITTGAPILLDEKFAGKGVFWGGEGQPATEAGAHADQAQARVQAEAEQENTNLAAIQVAPNLDEAIAAANVAAQGAPMADRINENAGLLTEALSRLERHMDTERAFAEQEAERNQAWIQSVAGKSAGAGIIGQKMREQLGLPEPAAPAVEPVADVPEIAQPAAVQAPIAEQPKPIPETNVPSKVPEWQAFGKESGTLGIPRADMPQVKAEHRGALVNFLEARGVTHQQEEVPAGELKATQAEFSPAKVEKAKNFEGGDRSILVSSDNHIVDGHHQALAKAANGEPIQIIRLNAPIRDLLPLVHEFPSSQTDDGATKAAETSTAAPVAPVAAVTPKVDKILGRPVADIPLNKLRYFAERGGPRAKPLAIAEIARRDQVAQESRANAQSRRDQKNSPSRKFLRLVAEMGGLRTDGVLGGAKDVLGEANAVKLGGTVSRIFKAGGHGLDHMATLLHEMHWLTDEEYGDVDGGVARVKEMIREAANGQLAPVLEDDVQRAHEIDQEARYQEEAAKAHGVATTPEDLADIADIADALEVDEAAVNELLASVESDDLPADAFMASVQKVIEDDQRGIEEESRGSANAGQAAQAETAGAAEAKPAEVAPLELASQSEAELAQKERDAAAAKAVEESAAKAADEKSRKEREQKEIAQRSAAVADDFSLTGTSQVDKKTQSEIDRKAAEDQLAGQNDIFSQPANSLSAADLLRAAADKMDKPAEAPKPQAGAFDSEAFDKKRADTVKASRESGNTHLDKVLAAVETMRGKSIYYVHDPKVKGVIRTVDNRGNVYVNWSDAYSADKEMASETKDGKKTVMQSSLGPTDLKDYALAKPTQSGQANAQSGKVDKLGTVDTKGSIEKALAEKSHKKEADGDVRMADLSYVSFNDAVAATKEAIAAGMKAAPAQLHFALGMAMRDVDRVLAAATAAEPLFSRKADEPRVDQTQTEAFKRWSNNAPLIKSVDAEDHTFKTGERIVVEAFHGTKRPDRVGHKFMKSRATSGPMAFHTSSPVLASSYAQGKNDTSLNKEDVWNYDSWFRMKVPGQRNPVNLDRAWYYMTPEQKANIKALAPRIQTTDDGENIILGPEDNTRGNGGYHLEDQMVRGNPLKGLIEAWLSSGQLFNDETRFYEVLKLAGVDTSQIEMHDPSAEYPFVYKNFIAMQNPLVTSDVPQSVRDALLQAAKYDRTRASTGHSDIWAKENRTIRDWVRELTSPQNGDAAYVWTSIPDKVTAVLKSLGYDGIVDWSGKGGGHAHPVYIPFDEHQVKSAIGNKGKFDASKKSILMSRAAPTYTTNEAGDPLFAGNGFALAEPAQYDKVGATTFYEHVITDPNGKPTGVVSLGWQDDKVAQLTNIRVFEQGKGLGSRVIGDILNHSGTELYVRWIQPKAREFWQKIGTDIFTTEEGEDGTITQAGFAAAEASRATQNAAGRQGESAASAGPSLSASTEGHRAAGSEGQSAVGLTSSQFRQGIAQEFGERVAKRLIDSGVIAPLADQSKLPDHVVPFVRKGDTIFGFYDPVTDKTYAVLSNMKREMVRGLVLHEVGTHYGMDRMLGPAKFTAIMQRLDRMHVAGNQAVREARAMASKEAINPRQVPEETLAYLVQNHPTMGIVREIIAAIKAFLFKEFGIGANFLTADDMTMLAKAAVEHSAKEPVVNSSSTNPAFHKAFHGSPHDFDKFSIGKIGTGEGAQAYGHGLYFASNEAVAQHYKEALARDPRNAVNSVVSAIRNTHTQYGDAKIDDVYFELKRHPELAEFQNNSEVKQLILEAAQGSFANGAVSDAALAAFRKLDKLLPAESKGKLYHVELAPKESDYLDWDKPLSEQSEKVRAAVNRAAERIDNNSDRSSKDDGLVSALAGNGSGASIYAALSEHFADKSAKDDGWNSFVQTMNDRVTNQEAASKYLNSIGIPGIRYLDGSSRNKGEGNHNYVIFDDSNVKIEAKFSRADQTSSEAKSARSSADIVADIDRLGKDVLRLEDEIGKSTKDLNAIREYGKRRKDQVEVAARVAEKEREIASLEKALERTRRDLAKASREEKTIQPLDDHRNQMPLFSRSEAVGEGNPVSWDAPAPTKMDSFIYTLQDKQIDTKRVMQAIRKIAKVDDAQDVRLQEELYHGRTSKRVDDFLSGEMDPLITEMVARKVTLPEFEDYLHARHAQERNEQIAKINPDMPDGGSGMATQEARDYLANLAPEKKRAFESLAKKVDTINAVTRQMLVDYGLESQDTIDAWSAAYKNYVPLYREDMEGGQGTGQGFSVKGSATKRAMGSKRSVADILANVAAQREKAIVRGEKNRVANALVGLATENPNADFWKVDEPPKMRYVDDRTGLVTEIIDPMYKSRDNVVMARMPNSDGKIIERAVIFNDRDERAMRMAQALKNLDMDDLGVVLGMSAKVTRYFAAINTQYNPVFGVVNITRDTQGAMLNLSTTELAGKQKDVLKNIMPALKGIYQDLRAVRAGKEPTSAWAKIFEEFANVGGKTGYRDMFRTSKDRGEAIEREINKITEGKAKQAGRAIFDWLADYNDAMENAVRVAAYKVGIDNGMTKERAASLAKNLTVNFNRKGQIATQAGSLYAFFNASAQGTARLAETLAGPAGRKIIIGGLTLGAMQALALAASGFDDGEPPDFVRERNIIIPTGGKSYITIPMPLGLHVIPNLSRVATEYVLSGFRDPGKRITGLFGVFADALNPIGNAGLSLQSIAPTVIDPLAALAENKDFTGKPIYREQDAMNPKPGHARAKDTATAFSKVVSQSLNWMSGGTSYKPGMFSPTPDQIDYLMGQVTGGVGREISKTEQYAMSKFTGEDLPTYKTPLMGRFYGTADDASSQANAFYSNLKMLAEHEAEIKGRAKAHEPIADYIRENPEARLYKMADAEARVVSKLRKRKSDLLEHDASRESVQIVEAQIATRMKRLNDVVKQARGG